MSEIRENINNIIYLLTSDLIFDEKGGFEKLFFEFSESVRKYSKKIGVSPKKLEAVKWMLIDILNKQKNSVLIPDALKENFENRLNEVVFSTKLNKIKLSDGFNRGLAEGTLNNEITEKYSVLEKILSFKFSRKIEDEYAFWCFLKIGRLLSASYEKSENNIINKDLSMAEMNETLKFSFKNGDGTQAELLYNYKSLLKDKKVIYLILNKPGKAPVSFAFCTENENMAELHFLRDSLCGEKNGKTHFIFSGIFLLSHSDSDCAEDCLEATKNKIGKINFSPKNTQALSNLLSKIGFYETAAEEYICNEELFDRLWKYELEKRNMLIATVKSKEQLEINIKNNFYYMPATLLPTAPCNYEYIAVYQSHTLFGENSGIVYFGEICDAFSVRRNEIEEIYKDSNENYLRFSVNWKEKEKKLIADTAVRTFLETSYRIFSEAKCVSELFVKTAEEYKIYKFLKNNFDDVKISAGENGICEIKADSFTLEFNLTKMSFLDDENIVFSVSRYFLQKNLKSVMNKISELKAEKVKKTEDKKK